MFKLGDSTIQYDGHCWNLKVPNPDRTIKGHRIQGRGYKTHYYGSLAAVIKGLLDHRIGVAAEEQEDLYKVIKKAHDSLSKQIALAAKEFLDLELEEVKLKVNHKAEVSRKARAELDKKRSRKKRRPRKTRTPRSK